MHFWKYCGAGNDFVILENFDGIHRAGALGRTGRGAVREHFSVGAYG